MTKQARQTGKRARRDQHVAPLPGDGLQVQPRPQAATKPWQPITDAQAALKNALDVYAVTFAVGEFGTGKTFVPGCDAADKFMAGEVDKIIITRPAVGCDEELGFLPGDLLEKIAPWAKPVVEVLEERLGAGYVEYLIKVGKIEIAPLAFLRGRTFANAYVILDEAQNTTPRQMKLFLSRIGEGTTMVIDGDLEQQDIAGKSGLEDAIERFKGHPSFGYVEFGVEDIVRSGVAREICYGYSARYARMQHAPAFFKARVPLAAAA